MHWDEDFYWKDGAWAYHHLKAGAQDPKTLKRNAYRVLMTRGRDCTIIYMPYKAILKETWSLFVDELGVQVL